ncbi:CC/Se motif family (seleno)protein [Desulfitobacterium sp.]|uniref:CC/Se motif family (seleno)protein n=1 Tax=Desulfitobacterium sp. TaxID=49981 RepID=UPI002C4AB6A1|nr:CC/Se motif family (seleno)protein [Desulfitobacterium sp.]HVJ49467.1 CC/Se motif family (seleno)protein [Desulfitobacterium sp.]
MDLKNQAISFTFTPKAKEYLLQKPPVSVYIEDMTLEACCIPIVSPPQVRRGTPLKPEKFISLEADGITIYYDRFLPKRPEITIELFGVGFLKGLRIADWKINI